MKRLHCSSFHNIDAVFWQLFYIACYSQLIFKSMTQSEIKFNTIKLINGIKYMTKNQIEDCKAYVRHSLRLDDMEAEKLNEPQKPQLNIGAVSS